MTGETKRSYKAALGVAVPVARVRTTTGRRQEHRRSVARYIGRRLQITTESGRDVEYTEDDFFATRGPLVVLGDPGVGKSRLVEQFCKKSGTETCVKAVSLPMYQSSQHLLREEVFPRKTVIDEVDAATAGESIVEKVLAHLGHFNEANFVLVCRSADWVEAGLHAIADRWGKLPTVGTLLPLDEKGAIQLVDRLDTEWEGNEFLEEARERGLAPLLGNPQLLLMMLKIAGDNWPESKGDLYRNVCRELAKEKNPIHRNFSDRHRPGADTLCDTAGFVCAQLLLSGTEGVGITRPGELPDAGDLSSDTYSRHRVESAVTTNLFHARGDHTLVPAHRTIAEYLAAKWLVKSLDKSGLWRRDLEALLRVSSDMVPSSTRGLHAWIASLAGRGDVRNRFIKRDPYGFWCYGDRDELAEKEAIGLLDALTAHAKDHPGFYDGSGRVSFGQWPGAGHLMGHIADRIGDRDTPPGMVRLLVESIHTAPHSRHLNDALKNVVLDTKASNRTLCLNSLARSAGDSVLNKIVGQLLDMEDVESLCVANDAIIRQPDRIEGKTIACALANSRAHTEYLGLGEYGIYRRLSARKTGACLRETEKIAAGTDGPRAYGAQRSIVPLLERLFELGAPPAPADFWRLLSLVGRPWNFENDPDSKTTRHLKEHDEYRRKTQATAILDAELGELETRLLHLGMYWPALAVRENDWISHLEDLAKQQKQDWRRRWQTLFAYGWGCRFSGAPMERAVELSKRHKLSHPFGNGKPSGATAATGESPSAGVNGPPEIEEDPALAKWRAAYAQHKEDVASGKAIGLLQRAAFTYFGHGSAEGATPEERIARLAGPAQVDNVLAGIRKIVNEDASISMARKLAESWAQGKPDGNAYILLVHFHKLEGSSDDFAKVRPDTVRAALAACHLNPWADQYDWHLRVRERLERIVFGNSRETKQYFRDIVEPYLERRADSVHGIDVLLTRPGLSDVAGQLSHEWMKAHPGLPESTFGHLLTLARAGRAHAKVARFVRSKVKKGSGPPLGDRDNLMWAAFEFDFPRQRRAIAEYAHESKEHFWRFSESLKHMGDPKPEQIQFVVETFAPVWPRTDYPGGTRVGDRHPWEASFAIIDLIGTLENDMSKEATDALAHLAGLAQLGGYDRHVQNAYSKQRRGHLDLAEAPLSLDQVRNAFLERNPVGHRHLLAIVMDALEDIQDHIRNSETDEIEVYRADPKKSRENYCRDRIKEALTRELGKHGVSVVPEAHMPRGKRADLLCQFSDDLRVPIEIKMGTSRDVWSAPTEQLPKYARICGANRTVVYLVLWFGQALGGQPAGRLSPDNRRPQSHRELKEMIDECTRDVPYNLRTFVMDLSGDEESREDLGETVAPSRPPRHLVGISGEARP